MNDQAREASANAFLGTEPVGKLMRKYALPCIISLLVGALYNIVDQIFIANADYLGSYGNAANTALYLIFAKPLLTMFGGTVNAETWRHSREYFFWITTGIPFYMFGQAMNPVIRADGSLRFAMASTLAGAVVNIILDPVFIFLCRWGMMGAAVATVIGQAVTAALAVWYLLHMKNVRPGREDFRPEGWLVRCMAALGMTSFLSQISLVASMAAVNNMIRKYGALDPVFGQEELAQIPIAVVGAAALVIVEVFPTQLTAVFGAANESPYYLQFAVKCFRIYLCMVVFACVNKACFIFLQAMGKALPSTVLSMIREVLFGVGFALLLPLWFGLDGVLYSMPVSDLLTFVIAAVLIAGTYRELR